MPRRSLVALILCFPLSSLAAEEAGPPASLAGTLVASRWQRAVGAGAPLAAEVTTWTFAADGCYERSFTADFASRETGAWAVAAASEREGVLFLARNGGASATGSAVLSLRFADGELRLGEDGYRAVPRSSADGTPEADAQARLAVAPSRRRGAFALWAAMTSTAWRTESTSPADPSRYAFRGSGRYGATFDATRCTYSGTWSLVSTGADSGLLRMSVPENRCDPRGPAAAFVREVPVELEGKELRLYETAYLPSCREEG